MTRIALILVMTLSVALAAGRSARAHFAQEAPWGPIAAAYRTSLFLADLEPAPWPLIEAAWTAPNGAAIPQEPAIERIIAGEGGEAAAAAIMAAVAAQDRQSLFERATRAISAALRARLLAAQQGLDDGAAGAPIAEAQGLYRAFERVIAQSDPEGWRELGQAWLHLTSAAGARGVLGAGAIPTDRDRFDAAVSVIDTYFEENYEPEDFTLRERMAPIPERVAAAGEKPEIAPELPPGSNIGVPSPMPKLVLAFEEEGVRERDLPMVAFGDMLFDSPQIFGEPARSLGLACSSCHTRGDVNRDFFIPGVSARPGSIDVDGSFFHGLFNDRRDDPIDIPSLRGIRFTGPYGRDGRVASLREFTRNVIVTEFAGAEPTPFMLDALVAYQLEFEFPPNAKLTGQGALTEAASAAARRGEAVFKRPFEQMDGKSCASCHIPSANFRDGVAHDIGSDDASYPGARAGAFDTPTLLGALYSAPYFHDGSLPSLASVVDWFDARYGLELSEADRIDLTAYLEAVGDADEPFESFEGRETAFRLNFDELTTFASALDTLIPMRDADHATILIDTVGADLAADASAMTNLAAQQSAYALSQAILAVGEAVAADDWERAAERWEAAKALEAEIQAEMY